MFWTKSDWIEFGLTTLVVIGVVIAACVPLALIGLFIYLGQDRAPTLVFTNRSRQDVVIRIHGEAFRLETGKQVRTTFVDETRGLNIKTSKNEEWSYTWSPLGGAYIHQHCISLQLEPDGQLYAFPPLQNSPPEKLPPQPEGWPLTPKEAGKNGVQEKKG
jgi:hypothetical protein